MGYLTMHAKAEMKMYSLSQYLNTHNILFSVILPSNQCRYILCYCSVSVR